MTSDNIVRIPQSIVIPVPSNQVQYNAPVVHIQKQQTNPNQIYCPPARLSGPPQDPNVIHVGLPNQACLIQSVPMNNVSIQGVPVTYIQINDKQKQGIPLDGFDAFTTLNNLPGLLVKQKPHYLERITCYEQENEYLIYPLNDKEEINDFSTPVFKACEHSECFQRQVCGNMRGFELEIQTVQEQVILYMKRPFKCQITPCCNLPEMSAFFPNNLQVPVGTVNSEFTLCSHDFNINDHNGFPLFTVHGGSCQPGELCSLPCGPCKVVSFEVQSLRTNHVGTIRKVYQSCTRELLTDSDNYTIIFPPESTLNEKILLLTSTFLIDMLYFEDKNLRHM
ncbi:hypothetical protein WA158_000630 [Blastocystis sp. Blastoise]